MGWNNVVYGGGNCCGGSPDYGNNSGSNDSRCNGKDLLRGVSKNDFVKVFLKNSQSVKGFVADISDNILTLFNCHEHGISSTSICLDDIVAVKTFANVFDPEDNDCDKHHC
ncbi:MAG: hypothetical protein ABF651_00710 [Sporolactobacillus sp.]